MSNQTSLEAFLRTKATELNVNFDNIPKWVIKSLNDLDKESSVLNQRQNMIDRAMHLLCDSDEMTTEEMVEAIANHPDEDDYIDNVDGVIVWYKVVNEFTCSAFLDEIDYVSK